MSIFSSGTKRNLLIALLVALFMAGCQKHTNTEFISINDPIIALTHVRVIDGTGDSSKEEQTIIIESGRITSIGPTSEIAIPAFATSLDLSGHTAIPGLVGMHEHLFYTTDGGKRDVTVAESFARLYLASGVTTIRTAGTLDLEKDEATKRSIDMEQRF